ncbi:heavy-metal-associated domain-containing protein [Glaciibacter superstes]|uniref:heavy-metal-associated domain-containing protein n=1 Tax=Glaciibacter superstes TaxID=501023 RepID=UPI0003B49AA0|nr:heavy-metal-associated domain-containing protein [Glaciibacter superstes]
MCTTEKNELGLNDVSCSCNSHSTAPEAAQSETGLATSTYTVTGMTCSHCVNSVTEEVNRIAGVKAVDVQLVADGASRVTVSSADLLDRKTVAAAIDEAGYQLVDEPR